MSPQLEQNPSPAAACAADAPPTGIVFDIMRFCIHDGPGIRTAVFLKGCPLGCSWCHNPEGKSKAIEVSYRENLCVRCGDCARTCPHDAVRDGGNAREPDRTACQACGTCIETCYANARQLVGREMAVDDVVREILADRPFFDQSHGGVTFTGGEPTLQSAFLESLLRASRLEGIHAAVETSGYCSLPVLQRISALTDLFLYDLKLMDSDQHRIWTGVTNERILANLVHLSDAGSNVVVRMPLLPGINDHTSNIEATLAFLLDKTRFRDIHLLPFHRTGKDKSFRLGKVMTMPDIPAPSTDDMNSISTFFRKGGLHVTIGG
jgi:pyruvate formate lyase activating enzyme